MRAAVGGYSNELTLEHFTPDEDLYNPDSATIAHLVDMANQTEHKFRIYGGIFTRSEPAELEIYKDFNHGHSQHRGYPNYYYDTGSRSIVVTNGILTREVSVINDATNSTTILPEGTPVVMRLSTDGTRKLAFADSRTNSGSPSPILPNGRHGRFNIPNNAYRPSSPNVSAYRPSSPMLLQGGRRRRRVTHRRRRRQTRTRRSGRRHRL
jgi:hypothetical protein